MAEPRNARQSGSGREYVWPQTGERFVSVTTVLSVINKPALVRWAAKMTAEYAANNLQAWQNLETAAAVDLLKGAPWRRTEERMSLGTSVHEAAEAWAKGEEITAYPENIRPYMRQFLCFLEEFEPEVMHSEVSAYNREFGYAGTMDLLARFGDELVLIDYKTGKQAYAEAELQLNAYAACEWIGLDDGTPIDMPKVNKAAVLLVRPRHFELLEARIHPRLFEAFKAALQLWKWQDRLAPAAFQRRWLPTLPSEPGSPLERRGRELLDELPDEETG